MPKILHIEDNAENRLLVRRILETRDYEVIECVDGLSGIRTAERERPDLILMDINLPEMDGHNAATVIRGTRGLEKIPIVAITSNVMPGAREEALVAGCDGYIGKPIDVDTFLSVIEEFLRGRQDRLDPAVQADYLTRYSRKLADALEAHTYARRFLEGMILQNPLSTLITDEEGVCVLHNENFVRTFNLVQPGGIVGVYNVREDPVLRAGSHAEDMRALFERNERVEFMAVFPVPGRGQRRIKVFGFPIVDDKGVLRNAVLQHEDVTEELLALEEQTRLADQLRQAQRMESIGTLAGGVAHDFNNLLVGVLGSVELIMKTTNEQDSAYRLLSMIRDSALRMSDLTKNLLAYSRRGTTHPETLDPNSAVMDTLPFLRRIAAPRLDVVPELAPSLPSIVADRTQFQQVLMNIVLNAVEAASGPGAVRITTAGPIEQPARGEGGEGYNHFIVIRITDNGKGMTPDVVEKIFDPFFTTKETGRGLGMSAVLGIVTSHGGTIHVESEPGKGTSVEILWPVQTRGEHEEKMEETLANPGGETVLVVDDEEIVRDVAAEILEGFGYRVVVATDGDESIDMVRKNSAIRLVLLDVLMERMDGLEAYTLLKEINPDLKVLVTSGYDADGPVKEIMQKGADGFIHKPFQIDELLGAVGRIIRPAGAEGADARPQN